jgi:hypothetical protein
VALDFLTVEVCTIRGWVTPYVLLFIDISTPGRRAIMSRSLVIASA